MPFDLQKSPLLNKPLDTSRDRSLKHLIIGTIGKLVNVNNLINFMISVCMMNHINFPQMVSYYVHIGNIKYVKMVTATLATNVMVPNVLLPYFTLLQKHIPHASNNLYNECSLHFLHSLDTAYLVVTLKMLLHTHPSPERPTFIKSMMHTLTDTNISLERKLTKY